MTPSEQSDIPNCPRCGARITFRQNGTIRPHADDLCGGPCWAGGKMVEEVRDAIRQLRRQMEASRS